MYKKVYILLTVSVLFFVTGCTSFEILPEKPQKGQENIKGDTQTTVPEEPQMPVEPIDPVEEIISHMGTQEKIGQLFMMDVRNDADGQPILGVNQQVDQVITTYKVGGIILFKENIKDKEQVKTFIKDMQALSEIPLFIGVDEEGGIVSRIGINKEIVEVPFKSAFDIGKTGDTDIAYYEAERMGKVLKELGFNMDFAPVADIYNNPENTVIGTRSFGKTKEQVTPMVIRYAQGLLDQEVQPVIKHFPGHGNTKEDSHNGIAYVNKTKEELEKEELVPFIEAVNSGIDVMMRGHLLVKDVDEEYPATLSKKWFDYMKTVLNTQKVLFITDAMNMGAVSENYTVEDAVVKGFLAGNDIILMPKDLKLAAEAINKAYEEGVITEERLNESIRKNLSKKVERNILVIE
ncbi:MAG: glycoside hydrolase [Clostridia bacterium]|jgi:beta-N-acetylhexosaminidase|nr:glycoside hydrolase [Clostridia bacterium]